MEMVGDAIASPSRSLAPCETTSPAKAGLANRRLRKLLPCITSLIAANSSRSASDFTRKPFPPSQRPPCETFESNDLRIGSAPPKASGRHNPIYLWQPDVQ